MFCQGECEENSYILFREEKNMPEVESKTIGMRRKPRQARSQERVNRILDVAEELFVTEGYTATTTNAIATKAKVPIGSLYQFFPDKSAILQALAIGYGEKLHQELLKIDDTEKITLSLSDYVDELINITDRFFTNNPSYYAIFMEVQSTIAQWQEIDESIDVGLIEDLAISLRKRNPTLLTEDYQAIAFVLVKVIGNLLWLSLSQENTFRQRLVKETKTLTLNYLKNYFPSD